MKKTIYLSALFTALVFASCGGNGLTPEQQEKKTLDSQDKADKALEDSMLKAMNSTDTSKPQ